MKRTLSLRREALTELRSDELAGVAGAQDPSIGSCPVKNCYTWTNDQIRTCVWCLTELC
jgi:hypothetical protein